MMATRITRKMWIWCVYGASRYPAFIPSSPWCDDDYDDDDDDILDLQARDDDKEKQNNHRRPPSPSFNVVVCIVLRMTSHGWGRRRRRRASEWRCNIPSRWGHYPTIISTYPIFNLEIYTYCRANPQEQITCAYLSILTAILPSYNIYRHSFNYAINWRKKNRNARVIYYLLCGIYDTFPNLLDEQLLQVCCVVDSVWLYILQIRQWGGGGSWLWSMTRGLHTM